MKVKILIIIMVSMLLLANISCGLEEYYYLPPIPQGGIFVSDNTKAEITIPNVYTPANGYGYFYTFKIFYRIYIS